MREFRPNHADLVDSHCHLDTSSFDADRDDVIDRARDAGVRQMIVAGIGPESWQQQLDVVARHPQLFATVGIHPWRLAEYCVRDGVDATLARCATWMEDLAQIATHPTVVGIGETGVDGTRHGSDAPWPLQEHYLLAHLALAHELDKPLVLHSLRAGLRALGTIKSAASRGLRVRGQVHSFSGAAAEAAEWMQLGWMLSVSGAITWPNNTKGPKTVATIPLDSLLVETDAPDQSLFGGRGEPADLVSVIARVAEIRDCDAVDVAVATSQNARTLFGLPEPTGETETEHDD